MGLLLGLVMPILITITPFAILIVIGTKRNKLSRGRFGFLILGCFLLGLVAPPIAILVSAKGLMYNFGPDDPKCVTGAATFLPFGYLINLIGISISAIILFPKKQGLKQKI